MGIAPASCATSSLWCLPTTDCSVMSQWLLAPACWSDSALGWQQLASQNLTLPAASVPLPPTDAQIEAVQASSDPGAAADALAQSLSNQAVLSTDASVNATVIPTYADSLILNPFSGLNLPGLFPTFCGAGSVQLVTGIDNCTLALLTVGGIAGLIGLVAFMGRR
jgi:hypothetical protein